MALLTFEMHLSDTRGLKCKYKNWPMDEEVHTPVSSQCRLAHTCYHSFSRHRAEGPLWDGILSCLLVLLSAFCSGKKKTDVPFFSSGELVKMILHRRFFFCSSLLRCHSSFKEGSGKKLQKTNWVINRRGSYEAVLKCASSL